MVPIGIGRVSPFLKVVNEVLTENRREAVTQVQVDIFGEHMREFWQFGPDESRHINRWLADNCFGDYYTREGLT